MSLPCGDPAYDLTLKSYYNSGESSVQTASTTAPPSDATSFVCSSIGSESVDLTWTPSASGSLASQYLYQDRSHIQSFTATGASTTVPNLAASTEYVFHLTSLNANGDEGSGATVTCQTSGGTPPDTTPPVGTVIINNDDTYTTSNLVDLTLTTNDAAVMKFSNVSA